MQGHPQEGKEQGGCTELQEEEDRPDRPAGAAGGGGATAKKEAHQRARGALQAERGVGEQAERSRVRHPEGDEQERQGVCTGPVIAKCRQGRQQATPQGRCGGGGCSRHRHRSSAGHQSQSGGERIRGSGRCWELPGSVRVEAGSIIGDKAQLRKGSICGWMNGGSTLFKKETWL